MNIRVDVQSVLSLTGTVLRWLSLTFLIPASTALLYGESPLSFFLVMALSFLIGMGLEGLEPEPDLKPREAFLMVTLSWLAVAVVGSLPYVLEGSGSLAHPLNALFESMSGFTTTGSTILSTISTEKHGYGLLMWRQLTQWLGGMGIIVLAVAILPKLSIGGAQLMEQEAPGPGLEKLTPRIVHTARRLWLLYVGLTLFQAVLLYSYYMMGWAPKMNLYHSVSHAFTTLPTGGFSPEARSIEAFTATVQWTIIPFMVLAGTNFALLWYVITGKVGTLIHNAEWRFYVVLLLGLSLVAFGLLWVPGSVDSGLESSLRASLFQVTSVMTTTGYASLDFNQWNPQLQGLLVLCMFLGGCAGSTGGAVKIVRWLVVLKSVGSELFTSVHSAAVNPIRLGRDVIKETTIRSILMFIFLYLFLFTAGTGVIMIDCHYNDLDRSFLEVIAASATTLGNVGPAFGAAGPMNNFLAFPPVSRFVMILLMWLGRLEIVTVLVVFTPAYWAS